MYEAFYGLTSKPFQLNPDHSFYFGSKQHRRATAYLEYGMHQNEGFIVITGEVGAGKTTIVRGLLESLDQEKFIAANLVSTQLDADDTLRLVGAAFGIRTKDAAKSVVLMTLEAFLISQASKGKRCLLIVDEAQNLSAHAVEELRMLSNFQYGNQALLQSFLIGQPEFRNILQSPEMMQFRQRVIASCHIGPLDVDETRAYIEHRLKCAGASEDSLLIRPDAFMAIFKASSGIPRRINSLCDRLLLMGFLNNKKEFDVADIEAVDREIQEETLGRDPMAEPAAPPAVADEGAQRALKPAGASSSVMAPEQVGQILAALSAGQFNDRLARFELGLLQLQQTNGAILDLLKELVPATPPQNPTDPET